MLTDNNGHLLRRPLVAKLLSNRMGIAVVSGLGGPTYDVHASGFDGPFFPFWGGMGLSAVCGLGLAMAQPEQRVLVVTGDGEMLMGLGSLATIAAQAPTNLAILVLDNQSFGETGRQSGLTSDCCDLPAIAKGAGFRSAMQLSRTEDIEQASTCLFEDKGPTICVASIALTDDPKSLPERDGVILRTRMQQTLQMELSQRNR